MLKRTAIKLFKEANITGVQDKPALGQAWCMYIDMLHRVTDRQVQNWSNPLQLK